MGRLIKEERVEIMEDDRRKYKSTSSEIAIEVCGTRRIGRERGVIGGHELKRAELGKKEWFNSYKRTREERSTAN